MPFPLIKLGSLLVKRISRPIAKAIKERAKTEPFLRNKILLPQAQVYHRIDSTLKGKLLDIGKIKAQPLGEENAINLAAEMLGEFVIFSMISLAIYAEYKRQQNKDQNMLDTQTQKLSDLESKINKLTAVVETLWEERCDPKSTESPSELKEGNKPNNADKVVDVPSQIRDSKSNVVLRVEHDRNREDPKDEK